MTIALSAKLLSRLPNFDTVFYLCAAREIVGRDGIDSPQPESMCRPGHVSPCAATRTIECRILWHARQTGSQQPATAATAAGGGAAGAAGATVTTAARPHWDT